MRAKAVALGAWMLVATFGAAGLLPLPAPLAPAAVPAAAAAAAAVGPAMPLAFEPNLGQADPAAVFVARAPGYALALAPDAAAFSLRGHVVRMTFPGAAAGAPVEGLDPLPGVSNHYLGSDAGAWLAEVPRFARAAYRGLWAGVDLVFYGTPEGLVEYDFVVAPGADPAVVRLAFEGAAPRVAASGDLVLATPGGELVQRAPVLYQPRGDERLAVAGAYAPRADGTVGFDVGPRDPALPLVIDPLLLYSQRIGGSYNASIANPLGNGWDRADDVAVDSFGNLYVMGTTTSFNFPVKNPVQGLIAGFADLFIAKFDPFGVLKYSTYLGGSQNNTLSYSPWPNNPWRDPQGGIGVDLAGNVYVTSATHSSDFPVTPGALQPTRTGGWDAVLVKLDPSGRLLVSTYFGGSSTEWPSGLALDAAGNVYVGGLTQSPNLPVSPGAAQATLRGVYSGWAAKFDADFSSVLYCTYYGGSSYDYPLAFTADRAGHAYIAGFTLSADLPRTNAWQPAMVASPDGFLAKVAPDGRSFVYSTYFGAWSDDYVNGVAADAAGNAYVVGFTSSTGLDIRGAAMQPLHAGGSFDGFLAKYNPAGSLVYTTYLGGSFADYAWAVAVDARERAVVAGHTTSTNLTFPLRTPYDDSLTGAADAFLTRIDTKAATPAAALGFSSYFGANARIRALAVDGPGNIYLGGYAGVVPKVNDTVPLPSGNANGDAFVAAFIEQCGAPPTTSASVAGPAGGGGWWRGGVLVTLTATSSSCPVPYTYYDLDGGPRLQGRLVPVSGDGAHVLWFHSEDLLGGIETPRKSVTVRLDATPPVTTASLAGSPGVGCWFRSPVDVAFAATDARPGIATSGVAPGGTWHRLGQQAWVQGASLRLTASGVHTVSYYSVDVAGNPEAPRSRGVCLDYLPPTAELLRPDGGNAYVLDIEDPLRPGLPATLVVGTLEVRAGAVDDPGGSGVHRVELVVDGVFRGVDFDAPFAIPWEAGGEAAGEHRVEVVAYDLAGNSARDGRTVLTVPTRHTGVMATVEGAAGETPLGAPGGAASTAGGDA